MSEFDALVKGVIADPGGAGVLADWLDERDRVKEAVLLRRYWETWQRTLYRCEKFAHLPGTQRAAERATANLRAYVRARFGGGGSSACACGACSGTEQRAGTLRCRASRGTRNRCAASGAPAAT